MRAPLLAALLFVTPVAFAQQGGPPEETGAPAAASAQAAQPSAAQTGFLPGLPLDVTGPLTLTLDAALQIARQQSIALRVADLGVQTANAQIREARSGLLPTASVSSSYTRNIVSPNPFAGSGAGGLFGSLGSVGWLAYNERARTDDNAATVPLTLDEFFRRQDEGQQAVGFDPATGGNLFGVPNAFSNNVALNQTLYNRAAFVALKGARTLRSASELGVERQGQTLVDAVQQQFFQALLTSEQARVVAQSVERARVTENEFARRVEAGTLPKFQRTTAEVQRANLETQLVQAENGAALALEALKVTLGVPADVALTLEGTLDAPALGPLDALAPDAIVAEALARRPDVKQARLGVRLQSINREITASSRFPTASAFVNVGYNGSVPDDRTGVIGDPAQPDNPFAFQRQSTGFFSGDYWQRSVNAGVRLSWNAFDGYRTSAQVQQRRIAERQAELTVSTLEQGVRLEVQRSLLTIGAARQRLVSTQQNVARAEENYAIAEQRVREGVATSLDLRDASELLDQARLSYLQVLFDLRVARSALETAVGLPVAASGTRPAGQ